MLLSWAFIAAMVASLLVQSLVMGRGLVNAGVALAVPPWSLPALSVPMNRILVDQTLVFAPERERMHREFLAGRFALWNPNLACGLPGIGSIQSANLFPLNILALPISPFFASGWLAFIKLTLAGGFAMLFARRLGLPTLAAATTGIVFALGGFMVFWLNHPHVNSVMWLPLLLLCTEVMLARRAGDPPVLIVWMIAATATGFMLLGGHPPSMVHILMAIAAYLIFRAIILRRASAIVPAALLLGFAVLVGVLIAAPQLLTYLEYHGLSSTNAASAHLNRNAEHFNESIWLHYLMPYVSGAPMLWGPDLRGYFGMTKYIESQTVYVGVTALLLTIVAILSRPTFRSTAIWLVVAAVGLTVAFGVWPLPWLWSKLPVLDQMNHTRLSILTTLALSITAGLGVAALPNFIASRWTALTAVLVVIIFSIGAVAWLRVRGGDLWTNPTAMPDRVFLIRQILLFVLPVAVFSVIVILPRELGVRWRQVVLVVVLAVELLVLGFGFNPAIPRQDYYPHTPGTRFIVENQGSERVLALAGILQPNTASALGIRDARGVDFASIRRFEELMTGNAGNFHFRVRVDELDRLALLPGVEYVATYANHGLLSPNLFDRVYQDELSIYKFRAAVPRAVVVHAARVESDDARALSLMRAGTINPTKVVLLESGESREAASDSGKNSSVEWLDETADEVSLRVNATAPGHLVLFDTWYPGWLAEVNGIPHAARRANYAFRAVEVPAGVSTVRWRYRPMTFSVGAAVSVMTLTLLACVACEAYRRRHAMA